MKTITKAELQVLLKHNNLTLKKQYKHDDYILSSFSCPYTVKQKLDKLSKEYGVTRSAFISMLIDTFEIKND